VAPAAPTTPDHTHRPTDSAFVTEQLPLDRTTEAVAAARITPATTELMEAVNAVAPKRVPRPRGPTVLASSITGFKKSSEVITAMVRSTGSSVAPSAQPATAPSAKPRAACTQGSLAPER
jgi:hypothetical protein